MTDTTLFRTRAASPGVLEVLVYDSIGDDIFGKGLTAAAIREQLASAGDVGAITVRINSKGGDTTEGFAIYQALREHPAPVTVKIDGDAMSIASIIAQAGDTRTMVSTARMMIHEARAFSGKPLKASDCDTLKEALLQVNDALVDVYSTRTGQDESTLREWMAKETYMGPKLALERGFIDEISSESAEQRIAAWAIDVQENTKNTGESEMDLTIITAALGIESDDQAVIAARIGELKTAAQERDDLILALGADSLEAAKGAVEAAKVAHTQAEELSVRVAALETAAQENERANLLAAIKAQGKSTPALESNVFPTMSLESLKAFAAAAPSLISKASAKAPSQSSSTSHEPMKAPNGKTFAELKPMERAALRAEDIDLYQALRQDALDRGLIQ